MFDRTFAPTHDGVLAQDIGIVHIFQNSSEVGTQRRDFKGQELQSDDHTLLHRGFADELV